MLEKLARASERTLNRTSEAKMKAIAAAVMIFNFLGLPDEWAAEAQHPFTASTRAETNARGAVTLVVALVVGGLMAAFLLPIAIDEIVTVDTTSWTDGAAAMWDILPVMIVLAIFLFFVGVALSKSGKF